MTHLTAAAKVVWSTQVGTSSSPRIRASAQRAAPPYTARDGACKQSSCSVGLAAGAIAGVTHVSHAVIERPILFCFCLSFRHCAFLSSSRNRKQSGLSPSVCDRIHSNTLNVFCFFLGAFDVLSKARDDFSHRHIF